MASKEFSQTESYRNFNLNRIKKSFYDEDADNGSMHDHLPFSGLSEWISEGSLIDRTIETFNLHRLAGVKQLSFLSYEIGGDSERQGIKNEFRHDRFDHSLVVGMLMDKILQRNNFSPQDHTLGVVAGMIHDIATPAGGDATKNIDPLNLHEEHHWQKMLTPDSKRFLDEERIDVADLDAVIKNEGVIGEILDIADRVCYTMKDVLNLVELGLHPAPISVYPANDVLRTLDTDKLVGNIYRDVLIDQNSNRPYFNDPTRLEAFLRLRALMHHSIYMDPTTSARNLLIAGMIKPFYTPDNPTIERPLTPTLLRQWGDKELIDYLNDRDVISHHNPNFLYSSLSYWDPDYLSFPTQDDAENALLQISEHEGIIPLGITQQKPFNTGENYLTKSDKGEILPFKDVQEEATDYLRSISESVSRFNVFYTNQDDLTEASVRAKSVLSFTP